MEEIREEIRITQINDDELFDEMPDIDDLEAEDGVSGGGQADGWMYEEIMRTLDDMGKKAAEQDYYIDGHRVDAEYFLSDAEKVAVECQKKIKELHQENLRLKHHEAKIEKLLRKIGEEIQMRDEQHEQVVRQLRDENDRLRARLNEMGVKE